jgi:hypothetical protein
MKKPQMIGTILANGFENTSVDPVLTVWTGLDSTRSGPVSSRKKCAQRCGNTRKSVGLFVGLLHRKEAYRSKEG